MLPFSIRQARGAKNIMQGGIALGDPEGLQVHSRTCVHCSAADPTIVDLQVCPEKYKKNIDDHDWEKYY